MESTGLLHVPLTPSLKTPIERLKFKPFLHSIQSFRQMTRHTVKIIRVFIYGIVCVALMLHWCAKQRLFGGHTPGNQLTGTGEDTVFPCSSRSCEMIISVLLEDK